MLTYSYTALWFFVPLLLVVRQISQSIHWIPREQAASKNSEQKLCAYTRSQKSWGLTHRNPERSGHSYTFCWKKGGQSYIWQRWKRGPFGTHIRSMPDIGSYPRPPPRGSSRMVDVLKGPSSWSVISKTASDWIIVEQWKVYRNMRYFSIIVSSSVPSEWLIKTLNEHNLCTTIWAIISRMTIYHKYTFYTVPSKQWVRQIIPKTSVFMRTTTSSACAIPTRW